MRKVKGIFGILVLLIGVLGTGYAYWADTLVVEATVATGNFDVIYCEQHTVGDTDGISTSSIELSDDHAMITVDKLVPGCEVKSVLCFENVGSVNAILKEIKLVLGESSDEDCIVQYKVTLGETIINATDMEMLKEEIEKLTDIMYVDQNECKSIEIVAFIPCDEENCQVGQDHTCSFEITFDWRQTMLSSSTTGPTDPVVPTGPTEPAGPTTPTDPVVPTGPTEPAGPTIPTDPVVPTGPTDPVVPTTPMIPTNPGNEISNSGGGGGAGAGYSYRMSSGNISKYGYFDFRFEYLKSFLKYFKGQPDKYQYKDGKYYNLSFMTNVLKMIERKY